ncbi:MAG: ATP-dependent DNA helicase [Clostridiales bacterium]|nr:ATP-dependent DNA helicase [Clostridiales bacterium]
MSQDNVREIQISVRNLVEFILRSGDMTSSKAKADPEAMQMGSRMHRRIQKRMGDNYDAEIPLSITVPVSFDDMDFSLTIEGRADGIIYNDKAEEDISLSKLDDTGDEAPEVFIDEIKGVFRELSHISEPVGVHRAQAMCYAYIYAVKFNHKRIGIRLTYCNLETEQLKYFEEAFSIEELSQWFDRLVNEYIKWAAWQLKWVEKRNLQIKALDFPFDYRPGQKELVTGVYKTILRRKKLFIEAPTGVGKTISTVFPSVKAMGEGLVEKIFYLTAKTIARTVAEDTFKLLGEKGARLKVISLTAKEKLCVLDKPSCNPADCPRAKGHYDRINDAVFDLLTAQNDISRELIEEHAAKHCVCPYEMSLDVSLWADVIICDYNYVFDPVVALKRYFSADKPNEYVFLIDEAHNLVDRGREMYSAVLYKDDFLEVKHFVKDSRPKLTKLIDKCNNDLLKLKRACDEFEVLDNVDDFYMHLLSLMTEYDLLMQEGIGTEGEEEILKLYLDIRHFISIYEIHDDRYTIFTDYEEDRFRLKLQCMDPSKNLLNRMEKGRSSILFSATLLPIQYYMEQLGGKKDEDYAVYAPSSFPVENRLIMIANDVSTRYSRRNTREYQKICSYIKNFTEAKVGNYMVFFPSYQLLQAVASIAADQLEGLVIQSSSMTEAERESFLEQFVDEPASSRIGFCVMGGIFSEGIDLRNDRLIGAVIVGTGLPMVCNERELFRGYYDEKCNAGFEYSYLYPGINKVLQSGGRVIRTKDDKGAILLLDDRFTQQQYYSLFPREWFPNVVVNLSGMKKVLEEFWKEK